MKLALNYPGWVGKSTLPAHVLATLMGNASSFAIETTNETAEAFGMDVEKIKGTDASKKSRN